MFGQSLQKKEKNKSKYGLTRALFQIIYKKVSLWQYLFFLSKKFLISGRLWTKQVKETCHRVNVYIFCIERVYWKKRKGINRWNSQWLVLIKMPIDFNTLLISRTFFLLWINTVNDFICSIRTFLLVLHNFLDTLTMYVHSWHSYDHIKYFRRWCMWFIK